MKLIKLIAMLILTCTLTLPSTARHGEIVLQKVNQVEIESSWQSLTDTATVSIPSRYTFQEEEINIKDYLKVGDPIQIDLGYGAENTTRFTGYITRIKPGPLVTLECQDEMYSLKKKRVNVSYQSTTLPQLLQELASGYNIDAANVDLGAFRASNATVAQVLKKIREKWGQVAYYQNSTLYVGKVYSRGINQAVIPRFDLDQNVIKHRLEYLTEADRPIKVKAISNLSTGKKLTVELGDPDGDLRTLNFFNIKSQTDLQALAEAEFSKLQRPGFQGSMTVYGVPLIEHSHVVDITSSTYPERSGRYYIDTVNTSFSKSGFRQRLQVGAQA